MKNIYRWEAYEQVEGREYQDGGFEGLQNKQIINLKRRKSHPME
jgi:hypothetical protein